MLMGILRICEVSNSQVFQDVIRGFILYPLEANVKKELGGSKECDDLRGGRGRKLKRRAHQNN